MTRARDAVDAQRREPVHARANGADTDPLNWLEGSELSNHEVSEILQQNWIVPRLIAEGHIIAIVAPPNGGKTSIMFHVACELGTQHTVIYVDADTPPAEAKRKWELAKAGGVRYLTPDLKVGKSMRDVVENLERMSVADNLDLTGHVWFFDTLKRMANVINKDSLKHVLGLMRKLSSRGMTVILLAHTNKYRNADGEYVYEGTGDLLADVDELIFFEPRENPDRSLTVSTRCTKRRADIGEFTWDIAADRTVTQRSHYVDVAAEERARAQEDADSTAIDAIRECLANGPKIQTELVKYCADYRLTHKRVRSVLRRYRGRHWLEKSRDQNNALEYTAIPRLTAPPAKPAEAENRGLL